MNWEMLSAIGQVVAAVGVIPSLIYLAVQIREQNKERRRVGINILTAQWGDLVKTAQESREFAEVFLTRKHWLTDEFRAMVESIIAKNPEPTMYAAYETRDGGNAQGP